MDFDTANTGQPESAGVQRRQLLLFGSLLTVFTGASAISALGAASARAGVGDPSVDYIPVAEKGVPSGVARLDSDSNNR